MVLNILLKDYNKAVKKKELLDSPDIIKYDTKFKATHASPTSGLDSFQVR